MKIFWENLLGHRKQIKINRISCNIEDFEDINIKENEDIFIEGNFIKVKGFADVSFYISNNENNGYSNEIDLCFYAYYFDIKCSLEKNDINCSITVTERDYDGM